MHAPCVHCRHSQEPLTNFVPTPWRANAGGGPLLCETASWRAIVQESGSAAGLPQSVFLSPAFQSVCVPIGRSSPLQSMSEVRWCAVDVLGFKLATSID